MNPKRAQNTWIATLAASGLALAYLFLVFLPEQRAMRAFSDEIQGKEQYAATAGSVAAAMEIARGEIQRAAACSAAWHRSGPSDAELAAVFGTVNALAVQCGATPTRFDPDPALKMQTISRVPMAVGCTGSFRQIAQFLLELERLPQTIWAESLQIESNGESGDAVQCELNVVIFADNPDVSDQANLAG